MIGPDSYPSVVHVRKVRFLTNEFNRYKRGLETFRQANLWQSVHSNFHRVRATSMTHRRVENSLDTLGHFRLYWLIKNSELIELFKSVDGNADQLMDKNELKNALRKICETVDSKNTLYFLLSGVDLSEANLDRITLKGKCLKICVYYYNESQSFFN